MSSAYQGVLEDIPGIATSIAIRNVEHDVAVASFGIRTVANNIMATQPVITKAQRLGITKHQPEKLLQVYHSCCRSIPGVLVRKDCCIIANLIKRLEEHFHDYGLLDPFKIVFPVDATHQPDLSQEEVVNGDSFDQVVKVRYLYKEYLDINVDDVARSNEFYHRWTDNDKDGLHTDLTWTYHILKTIIETSFWNQLMKSYNQFPPAQRGGPLLLALLLQVQGMMK